MLLLRSVVAVLAWEQLLVTLASAILTPQDSPPVPVISSGLMSTNVFWRGQQASDGTVCALKPLKASFLHPRQHYFG
jgi:hypothetical protein